MVAVLPDDVNAAKGKVLILNVSNGDRAGLKRWLAAHADIHGGEAWFSRAEQAITDSDWDRAWHAAMSASRLSYVQAMAEAKVPVQRAVLQAATRGTPIQEERDKARLLKFDVSVDDTVGLRGWLTDQAPKYADTFWYAMVGQAVEQLDWHKAWKIAAYVSMVSHNKAYVEAKTPEEAAAALTPGVQPAPVDAQVHGQATAAAESPRLPNPIAAPMISRTTVMSQAVSTILAKPAARLIAAVALLAAAGAVISFAIFVWPTAYRYDHLDFGGVFPVRIHRFTGAAETLVPSTYPGQKDVAWVGAEEQLPAAAIASLRGGVILEGSSAEIFNNTEWTITKVRWNFATRPGDSVATRQLDESVFIRPNARDFVYPNLGSFGDGTPPRLTDAWGHRSAPD